VAEPALPNLIIIGSAKAGTTSLHSYLGLHPQVSMSREKELHFFTAALNWSRGLDWYQSWFDASAQVRGEASPSYTAYPTHAGVAQRMASIVPDARLIYLVRDPVERLVSNYVQRYADGRESRSLDAALADLETSDYVHRSMYHRQISQYLPSYPLERFLILEQKALKYQRQATLKQVFSFLGVDPNFEHPGFFREENQSRDKRCKTAMGLALKRSMVGKITARLPKRWQRSVNEILYRPFSTPVPQPILSLHLRQKLVEFLRPDTQAFRNLTGMPLSDWSV
jgi:hypothetical protein